MSTRIGDDKMNWWWRDELVMSRWIGDDKMDWGWRDGLVMVP